MKRQDELDRESIQIWCEQLEQCKPEGMDEETTRFLLKMYNIERTHILTKDMLNQAVEENGMALLIRKRVGAIHTYELTDCAVLTLSCLCDRPGIAVQMMNFIQYRCWKCRRKTVDMEVFLEIFPGTFFSMKDLQFMWDKQKFITGNGITANMLDFPEYMESIKNI